MKMIRYFSLLLLLFTLGNRVYAQEPVCGTTCTGIIIYDAQDAKIVGNKLTYKIYVARRGTFPAGSGSASVKKLRQKTLGLGSWAMHLTVDGNKISFRDFDKYFTKNIKFHGHFPMLDYNDEARTVPYESFTSVPEIEDSFDALGVGYGFATYIDANATVTMLKLEGLSAGDAGEYSLYFPDEDTPYYLGEVELELASTFPSSSTLRMAWYDVGNAANGWDNNPEVAILYSQTFIDVVPDVGSISAPEFAANQDTLICLDPDDATLNAADYTLNGLPDGADTCIWYITKGAPKTGTLVTTEAVLGVNSSVKANIEWKAADTYYINVYAKNTSDFSDTVFKEIKVNMYPSATLATDIYGCGTTADLEYINPIPDATITGTWLKADKTVLGVANPYTGITEEGTYWLALNNNGCRDTLETAVRLNQEPVSPLSDIAYATCSNNNINLTDTVVNPLINKGWNFNYFEDANCTIPVADATNAAVADGKIYYGVLDNGICKKDTIELAITIKNASEKLPDQLYATCDANEFSLSDTAINKLISQGWTFNYFTDAACTIPVPNGRATVAQGSTVDFYGVLITDGTTCDADTIKLTVTVKNPSVSLPDQLYATCDASEFSLSDTAINKLINQGWTFNYFTDAACTTPVPNGRATVAQGSTVDFYGVLITDGTTCDADTIKLTVTVKNPSVNLPDQLYATCNVNEFSLSDTAINKLINQGWTFNYFTDAACTIPVPNGRATVAQGSTVDFYGVLITDGTTCDADTIKLTVTVKNPSVSLPDQLYATCDASEFSLSDTAINKLINQGWTFNYFTDAACTTPVPNGRATVTAGSTVDFYGVLITDGTTCDADTIKLTVTVKNPSVNLPDQLYATCNVNEFSLSDTAINKLINQGWTFNYFTDAACTNPIANGRASVTAGSTVDFYGVLITDGTTCDADTIKLTVTVKNPSVNLPDQLYATCDASEFSLSDTAINKLINQGWTFNYFTDAACTTPVPNGRATVTAGSTVDFYGVLITDGTTCDADTIKLTVTVKNPSVNLPDQLYATCDVNEFSLSDTAINKLINQGWTFNYFTDAACTTPVPNGRATVTAGSTVDFYGVLITDGTTCDADTIKLTVTVKNPSVSLPDQLYATCDASEFSLSDTAINKLINQGWTFNYFTDAACTTPVPNGRATVTAGSTVDFYGVLITDGTTCDADTIKLTVTVKNPSVNLPDQLYATCNVNEFSLSDTAINKLINQGWTFNYFTDAACTTPVPNGRATVTAGSTVDFYGVLKTDGTTCDADTIKLTVTVKNPSVNLPDQLYATCKGGTIDLNDPGMNTLVTQGWIFDYYTDSVCSSGNKMTNTQVTFDSDTTFYGVLKTDGTTCDADTIKLSIRLGAPKLELTISQNCIGDTVRVKNTGTPADDYIWIVNGVEQASADTFYVITALGDYDIKVVGTAGTCVSDTAKLSGTIGTAPTLAWQVAPPRRETLGNDVKVAAVAAGGIAPYQYKWIRPDATSTDSTNSIDAITAGDHVFELYAIDRNGCVTDTLRDTTSVAGTEMYVYANSRYGDIVCLNGSVILDIDSIVGGINPFVIEWTKEGTADIIGSNSPLILTNITADANYVVKVTDDGGLVAYDTVKLKYNAGLTAPQISAGVDMTVPATNTTTVLMGTILTAGTPHYNWHWTPANKLIGGEDTIQYPATINNLTSDQNYIAYVVDANSCMSNMDSARVILDNASFAIKATATPDTMCINNTSLFIAEVVSGTLVPDTCFWTPATGLSAQIGDTVTYTAAAAGEYTYIVLAKKGGKQSAAKVDVFVKADHAPVLAWLNLDSVHCVGDTLKLGVSGEAVKANGFNWMINDVLSTLVKGDRYGFDQSGNFGVKVVADADNGCQSDTLAADVTIGVIPKITLNRDNKYVVLHRDSVDEMTAVIDPATDIKIKWEAFDPADYTTVLTGKIDGKDSVETVKTTAVNADVDYILTVTNKVVNVCQSTDTAKVFMIPDAPKLKIDTVNTLHKIKLYWDGVDLADSFRIKSIKWDPYNLLGNGYQTENSYNGTALTWNEPAMDTLEFYYASTLRYIAPLDSIVESLSSDTLGYSWSPLPKSKIVYVPYIFDMTSYSVSTTKDLGENLLEITIGATIDVWSVNTHIFSRTLYKNTGPVPQRGWNPALPLESGNMLKILGGRIDDELLLYGKLEQINYEFTTPNPANSAYPVYVGHSLLLADKINSENVVNTFKDGSLTADKIVDAISQWDIDKQEWQMSFYKGTGPVPLRGWQKVFPVKTNMPFKLVFKNKNTIYWP